MALNVDLIIPFHRPIDGYLIDAIDSAKNSKGVSVRIVLINDRKENYESTNILKKMGYEVYQVDHFGYSGCLNEGISRSSGDFIAILNSDDLQTPTRLKLQISAMLTDGTGISIARLKKFGGGFFSYDLTGPQPKFEYDSKLLLLGAFGANASLVMSRQFLRNKVFENVPMADWKFAFEHYRDSISFIDQELYLYRMHSRQISRRLNIRPEWLYESWRRSFATISSAKLSNRAIQAIATPGLRSKLNTSEYSQFILGLIDLKHYFTERSPKTLDLKSLNRIIARRIIIENDLKPFFSSKKSELRLLFLENFQREYFQLLKEGVLGGKNMRNYKD